MSEILQVENLSKKYKKFSLKDVNFSIPKGFIMGLIGKNGAGKTTTIKLLLNNITRSSGTINILGLDNIGEELAIKEQIGVIFDSNCFPVSWKIRDVEKAVRLFYSTWNTSKFENYLSKFHIEPTKKVSELSRGMQMKLMLACALSYDNQLLILDEPTSGLDPVSRDQILSILSEYVEDENRSVLFSTHITSDLEKVADYITYLKDGEVFYSGDKDEFIDSFRIIKGGLNELTEALEDKLVGIRKYSTGFDGLIRTQDTKDLSGFLIDPVTIDDIIIFTNEEDENA